VRNCVYRQAAAVARRILLRADTRGNWKLEDGDFAVMLSLLLLRHVERHTAFYSAVQQK
jgi:hypothetical protein